MHPQRHCLYVCPCATVSHIRMYVCMSVCIVILMECRYVDYFFSLGFRASLWMLLVAVFVLYICAYLRGHCRPWGVMSLLDSCKLLGECHCQSLSLSPSATTSSQLLFYCVWVTGCCGCVGNAPAVVVQLLTATWAMVWLEAGQLTLKLPFVWKWTHLVSIMWMVCAIL